jgi:phosphoglycolate phosphatase
MALKLVLFDMDGTLLDSRWSIVTAMTIGYQALNLPPPEPERIRHIVGLSLAEAVETMSPDLSPEWRRAVGESYRTAYLALNGDPRHREPLFPGVVEAMDALAAAGLLLGVATGKSRAGLDAVLARHGLTDRFITLQTSDGVPSKPAPDMVLKALDAVGVDAADTVVIGDTSHDITMAINAEVRSLGVTWGFHERPALEAAGADAIVDDAAELPDAVFRLLNVERREAEPA